ncbi:MAG: hypothetical protein HOW73_43485 [Polyangiaceae bacterium]|nr:hypothetical protein [Polyangiaceae bacterium]
MAELPMPRLTVFADGVEHRFELPENATAAEVNAAFAASGLGIRAVDPDDPEQKAHAEARERERQRVVQERADLLKRVEVLRARATRGSIGGHATPPTKDEWALIVLGLSLYAEAVEDGV